MIGIKKILLLVMLSCTSFAYLYAQNYPVTGTLQLKPPYSLYLSDYTLIEEDKLIVNLLLNDPLDPVRDVKLKLKLESQDVTLETNPAWMPPPITLNSGFQDRLVGADLVEYFNANNLQFTRGITKQDYQRKSAIPEGFYKISIEVYDRTSGNLISQPISAHAWIVLNDPPRLLLPANTSIVKANDPQNLPFRWMPMNSGSPNSFFTTEYQFSLYEIWPATRNPNDAVNTTPPILQIDAPTSTYFYTIADPYLMPGRKYAWRVQARDLGGKDLYKNQGYSEVFSFTWGVECNTPINVTSESISSDRTKVSWDSQDNATGYTVHYREKDSTSVWYEVTTSINNAFLTGTKPEMNYEFQVKSSCSAIGSDYGQLYYFSTPQATGYLQKLNCNDRGTLPPITNKDPLISANISDQWTIGLFTVTLTKVSGSNGVFSGECLVDVPFLNGEMVAGFTNVKVNTNKQVYDGDMKVLSVSSYILPPEIRNALTQQLANIDKLVSDANGDYKNAKDLLANSKKIVSQVDDVTKQVVSALKNDTSSGSQSNTDLQKNIDKFKTNVKDGFKTILKGATDTTAGKDLLKTGIDGIKDAVGVIKTVGSDVLSGGVDKLKELINEILSKEKDSTTVKKSKMQLRKDSTSAVYESERLKLLNKDLQNNSSTENNDDDIAFVSDMYIIENLDDKFVETYNSNSLAAFLSLDRKLQSTSATLFYYAYYLEKIIENQQPEQLIKFIEGLKVKLGDDFLQIEKLILEGKFDDAKAILDKEVKDILLELTLTNFE